MDTPSSPTGTGRARRLLVTFVIATAAAAVTAGVALKDRHPGALGGQRAEAVDVSALTASPRHAPLSETAVTPPGSPLDAGASSDPSLPAAGDALKGHAGVGEETVPTF